MKYRILLGFINRFSGDIPASQNNHFLHQRRALCEDIQNLPDDVQFIHRSDTKLDNDRYFPRSMPARTKWAIVDKQSCELAYGRRVMRKGFSKFVGDPDTGIDHYVYVDVLAMMEWNELPRNALVRVEEMEVEGEGQGGVRVKYVWMSGSRFCISLYWTKNMNAEGCG
ncbi:hypothetical protein BDV96DRAFT_605739 [Lophiotrema nucula]|uniref:Uncharacterized protein n=1 Tax=Lophiotrema nucula TaxID=690887 RepID=A0A6A5YMP7_9PLEO|nr:hypothetical protein BDV96DRAFT_605739 [Lophiotrema nucula]